MHPSARSRRCGGAADQSLGSVPVQWSLSTVKAVGKEAGESTMRDDITARAAQLAYYFFLSLFPALIFLSSLLGLAARQSAALQGELLHGAAAALPPSAFAIVQNVLTQITHSSGGGKFTFGVVAALWSATSGMSAVQDTLNAVYRVEEGRPFWKRSLLAIAMTVGVVLLGILALAVFLLGAPLLHVLASHGTLTKGVAVLVRVGEFAVTFALLSLVFALTYYLAPDVSQRHWKWITPGAVVGILTWVAASLAFRAYLHYFDTYSKTYGAIGAVIILLLWFYVSGFALLFGAEINSAVENQNAQRGDPTAKPKGAKAASHA